MDGGIERLSLSCKLLYIHQQLLFLPLVANVATVDKPGIDVPERGLKYKDIMTKNHHIHGDVITGRNESRDVLIQGRFIQQGTL